MKKCNRCKVFRKSEDFKTEKHKTCKYCRQVSKEAYEAKKNGNLPKIAQVQKALEQAFIKGNFICNVCNIEKPISHFGKHKHSNKYNLSRVCKECSRDKNKISKLSRQYNISKEEFIKKFEEQNKKCAICSSEIRYLSRYKEKYGSACVDHNHKTGEVRGLLCSSCNRAIGLLKDDENILKNAYNYLVQYKSGELLENL